MQGHIDRIENVFRLGRFVHDLRNAAFLREISRIRHPVTCGVEDYRHVREAGLLTHLLDERRAVHVRHHDIGDHQVRPVGLDHR
jgi:hypothetical protein